jgi:hypothetical protein
MHMLWFHHILYKFSRPEGLGHRYANSLNLVEKKTYMTREIEFDMHGSSTMHRLSHN